MIPNILATANEHVDGWEREPSDGLKFGNGGRVVLVEREGAGSYTVLLRTEHGVVAESFKDSAEVAAAIAIGFMTEPALFEQRYLEAFGE